ncbi:MAG: UDP-N-acetylmuramate dehydrogenase, partial [Oscillospiraceae bacterium]
MKKYNLLENLCQEIGCEYAENQSMSQYTTFKVGRNASIIVLPRNSEQLSKIIKLCNESNYVYYILGKGSNLLFKDTGEDFAIISVANIKGIFVDETTIVAKAGEHMSALCSAALENGLSGVEFAWGIPGTVGGAVYMNAGAYGGEIKDIITSAKVIDKFGNILTLSKDDMGLAYRKSNFQNDEYVILEATFTLKKDEKENIKQRMNDFISKRKDKQPLDFPSAGSTFKRPEG